jgi:hypothetical protein
MTGGRFFLGERAAGDRRWIASRPRTTDSIRVSPTPRTLLPHRATPWATHTHAVSNSKAEEYARLAVGVASPGGHPRQPLDRWPRRTHPVRPLHHP